jgi:hypothetical protein
MDEQKLKVELQTMDQAPRRVWITPTFQRVDMKEAMSVLHPSGSTGDGGGANRYTS